MSTDSEDTDDTGSEGDSESEFSAGLMLPMWIRIGQLFVQNGTFDILNYICVILYTILIRHGKNLSSTSLQKPE